MRKKVVFTALAACMVIAVGAAGGVYVYGAPERSYNEAYTSYAHVFDDYETVMADAEATWAACEENTGLVPDVMICGALESVRAESVELERVPRVADDVARSVFDKATGVITREHVMVDKVRTRVGEAAAQAKDDLAVQTQTFRATADEQVAAVETRLAETRAAVEEVASDGGDSTIIEDFTVKAQGLEAAISDYRGLDPDTYASVVKAALDRVNDADDVLSEALDAVNAAVPRGEQSGTPAQDNGTSSQSVREGAGSSSRGTSPAPGASRPSSGSRSGGRVSGVTPSGSSAPRGGSGTTPASPKPSTPAPKPSGGTPAQQWHDGTKMTEVDGGIAGDDGSFCSEVRNGQERQVPC